MFRKDPAPILRPGGAHVVVESTVLNESSRVRSALSAWVFGSSTIFWLVNLLGVSVIWFVGEFVASVRKILLMKGERKSTVLEDLVGIVGSSILTFLDLFPLPPYVLCEDFRPSSGNHSGSVLSFVGDSSAGREGNGDLTFSIPSDESLPPCLHSGLKMIFRRAGDCLAAALSAKLFSDSLLRI